MPPTLSPSRTVPRDFMPLVATIMALSAVAIALPLPAFPYIRAAYGLPPDSPQISQSITAFILGMSLPQVLYGPLSDSYGRRPILFAGLVIYVFGSIGSALAPDLPTLLFFRFIWGVGAAAGRVIVVALVRDCYEGEQMSRFMSMVFATFVLVPVFAPSLGSLLINLGSWDYVYWFCTIFSVGVGVWCFLRLPETLDPNHRLTFQVGPIGRAVVHVCTTRATALNTLAATMLMTSYTSYLASSELIVSEVFNRADQFPVIYGAVAAVTGIGSIINGRFVVRVGVDRVLRGAMSCYLICAALVSVIALLTDGRPSFWAWYPFLALMIGCNMLIFPNLRVVALNPMGRVAATASAITGAFTTGMSAALAMIIDRSTTSTVLPLSVAFCVCGLAAMLLAQQGGSLGAMALKHDKLEAD